MSSANSSPDQVALSSARASAIGIALLCAIPMADARADSGWNGIGVLYLFGLIPLLILLGAFFVSLFISRAPWLHKAWMAIGMAGALMAMMIPFLAKAINPPLYTTPLVWIVPALVWAAMSRWLKRRRPGAD